MPSWNRTGKVLHVFRNMNHNQQKKQLFIELFPLEKEKQWEKYLLMRFVLYALAVLFVLLFVAFFFIEQMAPMSAVDRLIRPEAGNGAVKKTIWYQTHFGAQGSVQVDLSEKQLTGKELEELFILGKKYVMENVLQQNVSVDKVSSNLNLMTDIPNTELVIAWKCDHPEYVSSTGTVFNQDMSEDIAEVLLEATLVYREEEEQLMIPIQVVPRELTANGEFLKQLGEEMKTHDEDTKAQDWLSLPMEIGDNTISWYIKSDTSIAYFLLLCGFICVAAVFHKEEKMRKKKQERKLQLLIDYPELVGKFMLLINAGMTVRAAFERIVYDYQERKKQMSSKFHYVYEELTLSLRELDMGKPEAIVYDAFGQKCGMLCYIRFTTILVQNLKKGTKGMVAMLESEAMEAYAKRTECAKRLGEEAGTKLLGPMFGILLIILVLVMVPAFTNFNI